MIDFIDKKDIGVTFSWYDSDDRIAKVIIEMFENYDQYDNLKYSLLNDGVIFDEDFGGLVTSNLIEQGKRALISYF